MSNSEAETRSYVEKYVSPVMEALLTDIILNKPTDVVFLTFLKFVYLRSISLLIG